MALENTPFSGKHSDLTKMVNGAFFNVQNELGFGFSEKVYENALVIALQELGLSVDQQIPITEYLAGKVAGESIADLLKSGVVLLELKSVKNLNGRHETQLLNYLKTTEIEVGLLLNFGPNAEFKRKVFDNERKGSLSWIKSESSTKK